MYNLYISLHIKKENLLSIKFYIIVLFYAIFYKAIAKMHPHAFLVKANITVKCRLMFFTFFISLKTNLTILRNFCYPFVLSRYGVS